MVEPLSKEQVRRAVERRNPAAVPLMLHKWWNDETAKKYGDDLKELAARYPDDVLSAPYRAPGDGEMLRKYPEYRWEYRDAPAEDQPRAHDARHVIADWSDLDEFLAKMPRGDLPESIEPTTEFVKNHADRYVLSGPWFLFYERLWTLLGMENTLAAFHERPEEMKRLGEALVEYYKQVARSLARAGVDGWLTSDDLGAQKALMFSPATFREFLKPWFAAVIAECHKHGLHFWLHSCGQLTEIMDDFCEIGLDVLHPIQAGCMDQRAVARRFGGRITFFPGVDVQYLLPGGTVEQVRQGIKGMIDTFDRPEGGLILGAGNAITSETPLENIEAYLDTITDYGREVRRRHRAA
ncbi:MAG: methylcobamide--CoM methyltransferase [Armatimonadota bacterium]|nr:MAG: methylcobamide--CoM methyltransferase [Armatimonadota bacterium]